MKATAHNYSPSDCSKCDSKAKGFLCSTSNPISQSITQFKVACRYNAGETIFRDGESSLGLFSVRSGVIKLESINEDGNAHTLRFVGPGGLLGYRSFFSGEAYTKSAVVIEDAEVCFMPRKEILKLFTTYPELGLKVVDQLSKDLKQAESKWVDQIDKGAAARVADALLFLNSKFSGSSWTRKEIAEWAGTTTETVIRTLAQFEKEGLISQNHKNFTILSFEKMTEKSNS